MSKLKIVKLYKWTFIIYAAGLLFCVVALTIHYQHEFFVPHEAGMQDEYYMDYVRNCVESELQERVRDHLAAQGFSGNEGDISLERTFHKLRLGRTTADYSAYTGAGIYKVGSTVFADVEYVDEWGMKRSYTVYYTYACEVRMLFNRKGLQVEKECQIQSADCIDWGMVDDASEPYAFWSWKMREENK